MKDIHNTVACIDGKFGEYYMAVDEGKRVGNPKTVNNYLYMDVI
jgi:hypothetical protein